MANLYNRWTAQSFPKFRQELQLHLPEDGAKHQTRKSDTSLRQQLGKNYRREEKLEGRGKNVPDVHYGRQSTVTGVKFKKQIDQRIRDNRRINTVAGLT
jgi:hypothetical protein